MTLNELRYFTVVAEEKSFSKAAELLFVAQPSLSQAIAKLEKQYNCSFFERKAKGLDITPAGEMYLKYAREIISLHKNMEMDLCEYNHQSVKSLNIGTITNHGSYFFPQTISKIKQQYPAINVALREYGKDSLEKSLVNGDVDVAVLRLPIRDPNIEYTVLGNEPIILMMSSDNPLAKNGYEAEGFDLPLINILPLKEECFLVFPKYDAVAHAVNPIFANAGFFPKNTLEVRSLELHEDLCKGSRYISIAPKPIWNSIGNNKLVSYFHIEENCSIPFSLVVATAKRKLPRHVEEYVELIIKYNEFRLREAAE